MTGAFAVLATDALACLARECPEARHAVDRALHERRVRIELARECFELVGGVVEPPSGGAAIVIRSSAPALYDVLVGEIDIIDALVSEQVHVRGAPDDVAAAAAAMTWFLEGALRCAAMPALFDRLAELAREEAV